MEEKKTDYKNTLNLPETGFPMKANLARSEPETIRRWQEEKTHEQMLRKNSGRAKYVLHDGPPYANGRIHMGHVLNKVLKDIIVKYKSMKGFFSPYVPGWDCHGLPIELQVDKSLGEKKNTTGLREKRKLCREYAARYVEIQKTEFVRLGVFGRWEAPYLTMTNSYEADIVGEFNKFVKLGYVYRGKKPVHWCPTDITALAEAEVEYADKESPSIYVRFRMLDEDALKLGLSGEDVYFIIWTTTPWTLPANLALAVNPDIEYVVIELPEGVYITAKALLSQFVLLLWSRDHPGDIKALPDSSIQLIEDFLKQNLGGKIIKQIRGNELAGMKARHPFYDRVSPVIPGDFVSVLEGTGIVHIAPGHGEDDYAAGLKYGLDIYAPVDDRGRFTDIGLPGINGEFVFKANPKIIELLKEKGALLKEGKISHSYPHCWRCKKPVIFRATEQWFISLGHNGLRQRCLEEIEKVRWVPHWGRERIKGMVERRPDWCISRQRAWGVPVALLCCGRCGEPVTDAATLDRIEALIREHGSDIWFEKDAAEFAAGDAGCRKCGGRGFLKKETDILDVWFDSGVSHAAVLDRDPELARPADMYLEGSDQHRGWFQSSLITSTGTGGAAPFKTVLTHGFVVDGKGRKMSKSLGNVVSPEEIIKKSGAEILRLWVSAEDYRDDIRLSSEIIDRLTEAYRKIRNTARYLLGNLNDYEAGREGKGKQNLLEIDRWALSRLQGLVRDVDAAYENFDFHEVYHRLYNFCVVDMSSFYLDILKDRLYTFRKDSAPRRAAQFVLREILLTMTGLMAPMLSFTAEEIWGHIKDRGAGSVFLSPFPEFKAGFHDPALEERWKALIEVRDEVNKALEIKRKERVIGNSLEAGVTLYAPEGLRKALEPYAEFLPSLFIVSQAEVSPGEAPAAAPDGVFESAAIAALRVKVEKAEGRKCERCWNYRVSVGTVPEAPEICSRCYEAIR